MSAADHRCRGRIVSQGLGLPSALAIGAFRPRRRILGLDVAGVVEAVGTGVKSFSPGDEVIAMFGSKFGGHAEYVCIPQEGAIASKPHDMTFAEAVRLVFGGTTAQPFLSRAAIRPGDLLHKGGLPHRGSVLRRHHGLRRARALRTGCAVRQSRRRPVAHHFRSERDAYSPQADQQERETGHRGHSHFGASHPASASLTQGENSTGLVHLGDRGRARGVKSPGLVVNAELHNAPSPKDMVRMPYRASPSSTCSTTSRRAGAPSLKILVTQSAS